MGLEDQGYSLHDLTLSELADEDLQPIVDLINLVSVEREPRHVDLSVDEFRLFADSPGQVRRRLVVNDDEGHPVALLQTNYPDDGSNPHLLRVGISVLPAHRRRGIGSELLAQAVEMGNDLNRPTLSSNVFDTVPDGNSFAEAVGAKRTLDFHMNTLEISDLDLDLLNLWLQQGPRRAPGYSVVLIDGSFPEDLLEGMAHLYLVLERDMPTPEGFEPRVWTPELVRRFMEHFLQGTEALTAVAVHDESGEAAGMSQLVRRNADPTKWIVTTTMVDPPHRGHALGKWVKAAVSLEALARWPGGEYQETGNAFSNDAMLGINRAMGFEHEYTMTDLEVDVGQAEKYLAGR